MRLTSAISDHGAISMFSSIGVQQAWHLLDPLTLLYKCRRKWETDPDAYSVGILTCTFPAASEWSYLRKHLQKFHLFCLYHNVYTLASFKFAYIKTSSAFDALGLIYGITNLPITSYRGDRTIFHTQAAFFTSRQSPHIMLICAFTGPAFLFIHVLQIFFFEIS